MSDFDPQLFGQNVRRFRALRGYSMRDLAQRAGVSLKTIENIECGSGCRASIELRVATALQTFPGRLWNDVRPDLAEEQLVRQGDGRWFFNNLAEAGTYQKRSARGSGNGARRIRGDPDQIQDEAERLSLGYIGASVGFLQVKSGDIRSGHHLTCLVELFGRDTQASDEQGLTYQIQVQRGRLIFEIRESVFDLSAGDIVTFVETDPFSMQPAEKVLPGMLPPRFVITRLAMLNSNRRNKNFA